MSIGIGWAILAAYGAFMVGFVTSSILAATKIATLKARLNKRGYNKFQCGEWDE